MTLLNATIAGNRTGGGGSTAGLYGVAEALLTLRNSIVARNDGGTDLKGFGAGRAISNSDACVPGVPPGPGNICANPKLAGPTQGDVHQKLFSPTINRGANALVPATLKTDFEGDGRVLLGRVDMGADEFLAKDDPFKGVGILSSSVTVKDGVASILLLCPTFVPGPCRGDLSLVRPATGGKPKLDLGHHAFKIKKGKKKKVAVELTDDGRKALKNAGSIDAKATTVARDGINKKRTRSDKVKLKQP
jgi:hypothetical protein